jgi:glycosyltransferase involved in cell wall biosynthesis
MREDEIELSILMPCLNEAETIERCIRKANEFLARTGVIGEVPSVVNGSIDGRNRLPGRMVHAS